MRPDQIIAPVLFVDGVVRPVFRDPRSGGQYVIDLDGSPKVYGVWLRVKNFDADEPLTVDATR